MPLSALLLVGGGERTLDGTEEGAPQPPVRCRQFFVD
jgi:hypothetical protein